MKAHDLTDHGERRFQKAAHEFKAFALRGNVLDFVMAVVIGGAIGRIITACVDGLVMPTFAILLRETRWETWTYWQWRIGPVLSALLDFLAKALVLYLFLVKGGHLLGTGGRASDEGTPTCPYCREPVHPEATRCRACCSDLPPVVPRRGG